MPDESITPLFRILSTCKGGGYRYCRTDPPHPRRNAKGLYPLHRVLAENKLGRMLEPGEDVHHDDEDKANDDAENLVVKDHPAHARLHNPPLPLVEFTCAYCGAVRTTKPRYLRLRLARNKSGLVFCNKSCSRKFGC